MKHLKLPLRPSSFTPLLKACSSLRLLLPLHAHAVVLGVASTDPFVSSSVLHAYSKNGDVGSARKMFDEMPVRNVVPWSAIIGAYSQAGDVAMVFSLYNQMRRLDVEPNSVTFLSSLSEGLTVNQLQCIHGTVTKYGFDADVVLANLMINRYAKCGEVEIARRLFNLMSFKDIISWNSMLAGYSRSGCVRELLDLFERMRAAGVYPDRQTYGSLISCITNCQIGKIVHALVLTSGFELDMHVETALITMYLKFGCYDDAFFIFNCASDRDVISWTAMISGLVQNDGADKALDVFCRMLKSGMTPATTTIACTLSACAQLGSRNVGASIHGYIIRHELPLDIAIQNALVTMYAKCSLVAQCRYVFERMEARDLVSWNAVVSGHAQNGHLAEAFFLFCRMILASQRPDTITVVSLLQACASTGALSHGKLAHSFMIRNRLESSITLDTSLVDMYLKCGDLLVARRCFNLMTEHDLVSWSVIIAGYGSYGMGELALEMYKCSLRQGIEPNDVMFLSVLSACSHAGLVSEGLQTFKSMKDEFDLMPKLEHYGCIVDLLCRAGKVEKAFEFMRTMPQRPNADILGILLDACRTNRFVGLAEAVAEEIIALSPDSSGSYVQLAQSCAATRRWDGVGKAWAQMKAMGLKKTPAWSFIELEGAITSFYAGHSSLPQHQEMMMLLNILDGEMREIELH
ncbi:pentatricopeptide repeat-containing protein At4g04370 [Typha angustifolia]|uniref:pentatricopeptide repeat-containing protein At4g04370 n=1 Tax=Typha angustifolia TaxID=59011 RepID=UPI003C305400